jgi:nitroreductase
MSKLTPKFNTTRNLVADALASKAAAAPSAAAPEPAQKQKRPAPFSIRLSETDRARLADEAAGAPLGQYIKAKLLGGELLERKRRKGLSIQDRAALAQALALLGRSRVSSNLNQIAHAVNIGVLPVTPETEAELAGAVQDVRLMRRLLFSALGYRSEDRP